MRVISSGQAFHEKTESGLDTIAPGSGWWMYETKSEEELDADKEGRIKEFKAKYGDDSYYDDGYD